MKSGNTREKSVDKLEQKEKHLAKVWMVSDKKGGENEDAVRKEA